MSIKPAKIQTSLRIDAEKLHEAKEILTHLGLNFSEAVNIFTSMVVSKRGLPFEVSLPSKETEAAMKDVRESKNLEIMDLSKFKDELNQQWKNSFGTNSL